MDDGVAARIMRPASWAMLTRWSWISWRFKSVILRVAVIIALDDDVVELGLAWRGSFAMRLSDRDHFA
jgi:hypothetical protein